MTIIREERIGGQRLILGDCLEVMPLLGRNNAFTHATGGAVPAPATPQGGRRPVRAPRRLIDRDELTALIADGLGVTECAARMGFTTAAVTAAVKRWGLTPNDQRKSPASRARAAAQARAHWADPVYAARMGAHLRRANRKRWQAMPL